MQFALKGVVINGRSISFYIFYASFLIRYTIHNMYYKFDEPLKEAIIIDRPNRFIMNIFINGEIKEAHCPVTGRIGTFLFKNTPCLVSYSNSKNRRTEFTVEAISQQVPESKRKKWIGINQGRMNKYIEFFLKNNYLKKIISDGEDLVRERKLGNSRIDFKIGKTFIEVKTFLHSIPYGEGRETSFKVTSLDRLIKHFSDLAMYVRQIDGRAIVIIANMYNAKPFTPPKNSEGTKIGKAVKKAIIDGVENWQVNLKIDKNGVYLLDYFKLDLEI